MRVLVVTTVHHPEDARIRHRQIRALSEAGHDVTYAAPFAAYDVTPPAGVEAVDLPRAVGRRRLRALRAARRAVRSRADRVDLILLHDPELLLAVAGLRRPPTVWDVHEDTAAAVSLKPWLPPAARWATARLVRGLERLAERRVHLLLAEDGYATRFRRPHPVVPNTTYVPETVPAPGTDRVVYVGHLSTKRGTPEMVALGRALRRATGGEVSVHLVGHADEATAARLRGAHEAGDVRWHGYLPNDRALALVEGALAGLSLLHDEPNYRHSRPTKVLEYMARGVPVVTTPTAPARALVEAYGCGTVIDFGDPAAVAGRAAGAVLELRGDPARRERCARAGRAAARERFAWPAHAPAFVAVLEAVAAGSDALGAGSDL